MTSTIAAIETEYAGYRFRSRLEARWAVCFNEMGLDWEYEPQGFELPDGTRYLPDFHLTVAGIYAEVKGVLDEAGAQKILEFANAGNQILLLEDIPDPDKGAPDFHGIQAAKTGGVNIERVCMIASNANASGWELVMWGKPLHVRDITDPNVAKTLIGLLADRHLAKTDGWVRRPLWLENAFRAARQARFEHGETPRAFVRSSEAPS